MYYTILNIINNYKHLGINNFLATFIIASDMCSSQKNYVEMITTILNHKNMKINYDHNNTKLRKKYDRDYGIALLFAELTSNNNSDFDKLLFFTDYKIPSNRYNHDKTNTLLKNYRKKEVFVLKKLQIIETVIPNNIKLIGNEIEFDSIPIHALLKYKNLFNNKIRLSIQKYSNKKYNY